MSRRRAALADPFRRVRAVLVLAVAGSIALLGAGVPAASAHDELLVVTPADGGSLPAAPAELSLGFTGAVQEMGVEVVVLGPDGAPATRGPARVVGATVTQPLAPDLPGGSYTVAWRVTSADGHPITGTTTFTVTGDATAPGPVQEASAAQPAGMSSGTVIGIGAGAVLVLALVLAARQLRGRG